MNTRFREYVTEQAFSLTLKKTHIVVLDLLMRGDDDAGFNLFVPAIHGLIRRGLVIHHPPVRGDGRGLGMSKYYEITAAGKLAHGLLVEAGMIHEREAQVAA